jgi:hypothetical protein
MVCALSAQPRPKPPQVDLGALRAGVYTSRGFGFTYKLPYGWVDRTQGMNGEDGNGSAHLLLAAFEQPPEAARNAINSAVTISTESASSYPGLKTAADYLGPVTEVAKARGLDPVGDPYEFRIGAKPLVRADFKKQMGQTTMYWTSLAMLARGHLLLFTFVGSSEDEVDQLVGRLSFASPASGKH